MNNKINPLHEKCLRIVYNEKLSCFEELLDKDGSVTTNKINLQVLVTEMFKVLQVLVTEMFKVYRNLSPNIIAEVLRTRRNNYNLMHSSFFHFFVYLTSNITGLRVYPTYDREYGT